MDALAGSSGGRGGSESGSHGSAAQAAAAPASEAERVEYLKELLRAQKQLFLEEEEQVGLLWLCPDTDSLIH